jgi:ABC-2 type transport system permease protein
MSTVTYTRYELLRTFRSTRFFVFSLVFPLVMFFLVAGPNKDEKLAGIPFPVYYMTGMAAWGAMAAVISAGARIAAERSIGWNRQLRITPLATRAYLRAKVITGYTMALLTLLVLYAAGTMFGVRLPAGSWLTMTGLILVGLAPLALLGILIGHLLTVDALGPAMGGIVALLGLFGGVWGPVASTGVMHEVALVLPSYWLVQAGASAFNGHGWPARAWIVIVVWSAVVGRVAASVYRRDTQRV